MNLLWPAALTGLAVLLLPLIIHWLQRGEFKRIELSTTQYLSPRDKPQWRRLQLTEVSLLLVRLLLLVCAVFILAEPWKASSGDSVKESGWLLISPRLDAADIQNVLDREGDSLPSAIEQRWLSPGFPEISESRPVWAPKQGWQLIADADRALPDGQVLSVMMPLRSDEFAIHRPVLSREVRWIESPAPEGQAPLKNPGLNTWVIADPDRAEDAAAIANAIQIWRSVGIEGSHREIAPDQVDDAVLSIAEETVIWLSQATPPSNLNARVLLTDLPVDENAIPVTGHDHDFGKLYLGGDHLQAVLYVQGTGDVPALSASAALMRDPGFSEALLKTVLMTQVAEPMADYRIEPSALIASQASVESGSTTNRSSLIKPLAILLLLLWLSERLFSAVSMWRRSGP